MRRMKPVGSRRIFVRSTDDVMNELEILPERLLVKFDEQGGVRAIS